MLHAQEAVTDTHSAWFALGFDGREDRFVVELRDPTLVAAARAELDRPVEERRGVMGRVVKRPAGYNPGWSYHLDPSSIELFEQAIEVRDGNPRYIEEHLDEVCGALLPGCTWCPWSSYIAAEVATPARAYLLLRLEAGDNACDNDFIAGLRFDLTPLKTAYYEAYRGAPGPLILRLRGYDEPLRYTFEGRP